MKLSAEQIACIEALLALRAKGVTNIEIAKRLDLGNFGENKISFTFLVLEAMGLPVKKLRKGRGPAKSRQEKQAASTTAQPRRTFLSADQWQERLAQMGH